MQGRAPASLRASLRATLPAHCALTAAAPHRASLRAHCGLTAGSLRAHCGLTAGSLRAHCGLTADPKLKTFFELTSPIKVLGPSPVLFGELFGDDCAVCVCLPSNWSNTSPIKVLGPSPVLFGELFGDDCAVCVCPSFQLVKHFTDQSHSSCSSSCSVTTVRRVSVLPFLLLPSSSSFFFFFFFLYLSIYIYIYIIYINIK
jgi:hypothetical protein